MLGQFGEDYGSIGFGLNVDLASQKVKPAPDPVPEILVFAQHLARVPAGVHYRKGLEEQGILWGEQCFFDTLEETLEYAKKKRIPKVHVIGEEIESMRQLELP